MANVTQLSFEQVPSMGRSLLKAGLARKSGFVPEVGIPEIRATVQGVTPDAQHVAAFCKVAGHPFDGTLPPTYPQLLATPLHMQIVASKAFPLKALGLVHVRQTIAEHRPIAAGSVLDVDCRVSGYRWVKRGVEFDLITRVGSQGKLVWEASTTALSMIKRPEDAAPTAAVTWIPELDRAERSVIWRLPADLGRRYARVAGDRNPIHLYGWSAKLFGFKRAIIHGMWSLARGLAELADDLPEYPRRTQVQFRRPIFLPGSALFESSVSDGTVRLVATDTRSGKACFGGSVSTGCGLPLQDGSEVLEPAM